MHDLIARLAASAKSLGISLDSESFLDALEVATLAFEDRRGLQVAFEMGRGVLVAASTSGRSVKALTAA